MKVVGIIYIASGLEMIAVALYGLATSGLYPGLFVWSIIALALLWQARGLLLQRPSARIPAIVSSLVVVLCVVAIAYFLVIPVIGNFSTPGVPISAFSISGVPTWLLQTMLQLAILALAHVTALVLLFRPRRAAD